jgi:glucosamine-6-phosphate deaminase
LADQEKRFMQVVIARDREQMGAQAALRAAEVIRGAINQRGEATIVVATGASQFTVLSNLIRQPDVDWQRVIGFHLDEYIGLPITHPASFRGYLKERLVDRVPLKAFHYIDGEHSPVEDECTRLSDLIRQHDVDIALVGIGENGHLAFNDPPADFETEMPYIIVQLDEACRRQQWGEGWFPTLDDVPTRAISMTVRQILKSREIVCSVPDERKAQAVVAAVEGPVTPEVPASILQRHPQTTLYLDPPAAAKLTQKPSP